MKLLLAEDEKEMSNAVAAVLRHNNYTVDTVFNGLDAFDHAVGCEYDGIIMDIMMPSMDGITVVKRLREKGIGTPVLLLTAKSQVEDRINGLDSGADDYLTKPFAMGELLARIRAMTRRKGELSLSTLKVGNVTLDRDRFVISTPSGGEQKLGNKEFQMLELFMLNRNILLSTERIMEKIWGYDSDTEISVVWVYISNVRRKLDAVGADITVKASRGVGYTLEVKE